MEEGLQYYCKKFFDEVELYEDITNNRTHSKDFNHVLRVFLDKPTTDAALEVYEVYSRAYWMHANDDSIIRMIQDMRAFEEHAGVLTEKQRDHFVHSVFVFSLGISIYVCNPTYQKYFNAAIKHNGLYKDAYTTKHEEFLYRWGIASLFHDIAYPIEITHNQIKQYLNFISDKCGLTGNTLGVNLTISNSDVFNLLPKMNPKPEFNDDFFRKYPDFKVYETNALSLIALEISNSFSVPFCQIENAMICYVESMAENHYVDHGYYSALIILRWFYNLVDSKNWNPVYFYFPIVNAATSIILHNCYKHKLRKDPFNLPPLHAEKHPLTYLLILCDDLQDWGRQSFGFKDSEEKYPTSIKLNLENSRLAITYMDEDYAKNMSISTETKLKNLEQVLDISSVFTQFTVL